MSLFWLGAAEPAKVAESEQARKDLPSLHSPIFAPLRGPTIWTGVKAMTSAVLEVMKQ